MLKKKRMAFLLMALMLCLFSACGGGADETTAVATETEISHYNAEFLVNGHIIDQQQVAVGDAPKAPSTEIPGLIFVGWLDAQGEPVDVTAIKLTGDVTYRAQAYPVLDQHVPFLFMDEAGFLNPDGALSAWNLTRALEALASEEAKQYFPDIPAVEGSVTREHLTSVLSKFFPEEQVKQVLGQNEETVTRGQFAKVLCALLQRDLDERVAIAQEQQLPVDVSVEMENFAALLEASIPHTMDDTGETWESIGVLSSLEPGFLNRDGWLYYVQENGTFLRNGSVGVLEFGADGRYTCGDAELDEIVADVLNQIFIDNPEASRMDILRKAYEYTRDSFTYLRKEPYEKGATGWEIADGKKMFQDTRGNCYYFAGAFWALARGLGYEAQAVSGTCTGTHQPHAWVIINFDGEDYFFDPQWENNYHTREIYYHDMFMISMDKIWYWTYQW